MQKKDCVRGSEWGNVLPSEAPAGGVGGSQKVYRERAASLREWTAGKETKGGSE